MIQNLKHLESDSKLDPILVYELRKAILQMDRIESRKKGQRKLERIANMKHRVLSPFALAALASSCYWSGDIFGATYWCKNVILSYPMSTSALWCSTLLVSIYRMLGMKKERFEAEGDRLRIMKKIALQSSSIQDKIFALNELKSELEMRDRYNDAQKCQDELHDLMVEYTNEQLQSV
ncbi:MAG: hypothetical protein KDD48_09210 [Bdellovibrionales bacterium]|nr:hypothetical protein [Bdellovibrionales bacterium]